jgi:LacI family gluconate utilization system Gnt-I transcriptional repressor
MIKNFWQRCQKNLVALRALCQTGFRQKGNSGMTNEKISGMTISAVAAAAGVGESTVSRVLRNEGSFSHRSRDKVLKAAAELGYVPNRIAGSLASSGSRLVAIVVPSLTNIVFADLLRGAGEVLDAAKYQGVFGVSDYDPLKEQALIASFLEYRPAAVLLSGLEHSDESRKMLKSSGCRVVEMLDVGSDPIGTVVGFSNRQAGVAAADYLQGCGYRTIGYVGHDLAADKRAGKRLEGFYAHLQTCGLQLADREMTGGRSSVENGRNGLAALLGRRPDLDAVYFSNDDMAIGGYFHCLSQGIRIPEQLGILGHNGLDIGAQLPTRLSTIQTPRVEIGRLAAQLAIEAGEEKIVDLGFQIVTGQTTKRSSSP